MLMGRQLYCTIVSWARYHTYLSLSLFLKWYSCLQNVFFYIVRFIIISPMRTSALPQQQSKYKTLKGRYYGTIDLRVTYTVKIASKTMPVLYYTLTMQYVFRAVHMSGVCQFSDIVQSEPTKFWRFCPSDAKRQIFLLWNPDELNFVFISSKCLTSGGRHLAKDRQA